MRSRPALLVSIMLLFLLVTLAPATNAKTLTLEQCIDIALQHNPSLLSTQQQHRAAEARVLQARGYPQPTLDYDSDMQTGVVDMASSGESYLGISQTIEMPVRRSLRIKIASEESAEVAEQVGSSRMDLVLQVKTTFYELLLAEQKRTYAQQNLDLSGQFLDLAKVRFDTGDVAEVEVLRAEVEHARASSELRRANNEVALATARLAFLLALDREEPLTIQGQLQQPLLPIVEEQLSARSLASRPELRGLRLALHRGSLAERQAKLSLLPDVDIGVARHRIDGEGSFWDVTLSVPLPIFQQQRRGEVAEARANQEAVKRELEHTINAITLEVSEACRAARTAQEQITLFDEELLAEAEEVYKMCEFSFREGEIGGIELIEARRSLLEARTAYAEALFDYAMSLARLERAVGQPLQGATS